MHLKINICLILSVVPICFRCRANAQEKLLPGNSFLQFVINKDWPNAEKLFSASVIQQIRTAGLKNIFESLKSKVGELSTYDAKPLSMSDKHSQYFIGHFTNSDLTIKIAVNDSNKIVGFFFLPLTGLHKKANYYDESKINIQSVNIQGGSVPLPGIITTPKISLGQKFPIVICLGGSGPSDMDESLGAEKPFEDLSYGLAASGIATLRSNKRQTAYKGSLKNFTITDEYVVDIKNFIALVKTIQGVDTNKIYILGHSMGGMLAPLILKNYHQLAGAVLLEANARPLEDMVYEQSIHLAKQNKSYNKTIDSALIKNIRRIKYIAASDSDKMIFGANGNYWLSLKDYKPLITAAKLKKQRLLIIQGGNDYQVTVTDFNLWKNKLKDNHNVLFKFYNKINHALVEGNNTFSPSEYNIPLNTPLYMIEDIVAWINK